MKIQELIRKLERVEAELPTIVLNEISQTALDAKDMLQQRLQETGKDSKGNSFRPYTEEYERFKQGKTERRQPTDRFGGIARQIKPKKLKSYPNKDVGYVNFTYEDRMLNNVGVLDKQTERDKVKVVVGPRAEENRDKMAGNIKQRGDIMALSSKEISELAGNLKKRFPARIKKALQ